MGREQFVIDSFVALADTLAGDYDIADFLHDLVERCEEALGVDAGGVLLEDRDGTLRLVAATSTKMQRLEETEIRTNAGPCIDAYRNVEQVVAQDLDEIHDRWPDAIAAARDLGMRAVYAFPLRLRDDCIGALNLYREHVGPFGEDDTRLAQAFADVAAIGILQERAIGDAEIRATQLQGALDSRLVIEQAKGVIMATSGVSPEQAFDLLRSQARSTRRKLQAVARDVVERQAADFPA